MNFFPWIILLGVCAAAHGTKPDRPIVFVSIPPQAWIFDQMEGLSVEVHVMLPAASGHINYTPAPSQIRKLAQAELFVRSGLPFENAIWDRLREANPDMIVINAPVAADSHHAGHVHHGEHEHDPHFWLDPLLLLRQAEAIAAAFPEINHAPRPSLDGLRTRLTEVDAAVRAQIDVAPARVFWSFHASWGHFAARYGLEQRTIEFEGKESGMRTMLAIVKEIVESEPAFIVVEPGLDQDRLTAMRNASGVELVMLNPMRRDYDQNLLEIARTLAGVVQ